MKLSSRERKHLAGSAFGLPGKRAYPMPDREHAINAKARATQQYDKGHLTRAQYDKINRKANRKLGRGR